MVEADYVKRRRGGRSRCGRDVGRLVRPSDHRHRVPADDALDLRPSSRSPGYALLVTRNRVHVKRECSKGYQHDKTGPAPGFRRAFARSGPGTQNGFEDSTHSAVSAGRRRPVRSTVSKAQPAQSRTVIFKNAPVPGRCRIRPGVVGRVHPCDARWVRGSQSGREGQFDRWANPLVCHVFTKIG